MSLLSHLDSSALRELAEHSDGRAVAQGANIIRHGEQGDRFFRHARRESGGIDRLGGVSSALQPGDQFGEIALLHDVPRRADVTATSPRSP